MASHEFSQGDSKEPIGMSWRGLRLNDEGVGLMGIRVVGLGLRD